MDPEWDQALDTAGKVCIIREMEDPTGMRETTLDLLEVLRDYGWSFFNPYPLELLEQQLVLWGKQKLEEQLGVPLSAADPIDLSDAMAQVPDDCITDWGGGRKSLNVWEALESPDVDKYLKADIAVEFAKREYGYNLSNY
jgi:hypothetical protein